MAVAGDARPRHRRVDQAAVPLRPSTRMGAQAAAIPPATPIRTDRPSRPQNDPAALTRLALGRAARRRVQASASAPTPNRLTRGASGALPADQPRAPPGVSLPAKHPNTSAFGRKHHRDPRHAPQTPNQHPAAPSRHPQTPHRGPPGRLLQATRFRSYRKIEVRDRVRARVELERSVRERTHDLFRSRAATLQSLARAAEYRDYETAQHTERVGHNAARLAAQLGLPASLAALIREAAPLHDVGKIGIPDQILLKPAKLTPEEFEIMKQHTILGARLLAGSDGEVLQLGEQIALTHHERWDG